MNEINEDKMSEVSKIGQAQIKAAALALHRFEVEHGYISSETALTSDTTYQAMAKAALTAAADTGPANQESGIRETSGLGVTPTQAQLAALDAKMERNAIIERCAQLLDEKIAELKHEHWRWRESLGQDCAQPYDDVIAHLKEAAAALRKLKDEI